MIILTLIDPQRQTVLKEWQFQQETIVQIGRAQDNQIVLDESYVRQELLSLISRRHVTLQQINSQTWQLTSQGSNGTFINGNAVQQSTLTDGTQFQLARGGAIFKVQLQPTALSPVQIPIASTPQPQTQPEVTARPQPSIESAQLAALKAQLDTVIQERNSLQATLQEIQAQLPISSLSDRQTTLTKRLTEIQQLQALLHKEGAQLQTLPNAAQQSGNLVFTIADRDRLFSAITTTLTDIAKQLLELHQAQNQVKNAVQAIEKLNAHLQANQAIASQLSTEKTRSESLAEQIQNCLQEFDRELARIQELQATENVKQIFLL